MAEQTEARTAPAATERRGAAPRRVPRDGWERVTATCVVCPSCAFAFDAIHLDVFRNGYTCPLCETRSDDV